MKVLCALMLGLFFTNAYSVEYKEKIECIGNNCNKITTIKNLKEKPLRIEEYVANTCLVDVSGTNPVFLFVQKSEVSNKKITLLREVESNTKTYVHVMKKEIVFDKEIERLNYKKIPCDQTNSFFDANQLNTCISKHRNIPYKIYCDIK